ncbi:DUF5071 domain-containing protein [Saprospira sp. CCB-QB6]|uniref:DUF5071 domain-containing protein n=1 Tax=Saprospira sp. CCB-QB6 TaxID=3023936 RepID=UPI00234B339F|nr:DUF5071 domain-containing protein [Saprospira sp. CCB-QB6]WCL82530.1 DUF5071 domain-containing protein [Saprospira sp. CCB-QB6]
MSMYFFRPPFIPKDKHDDLAIDILAQTEPEIWLPFANELLEWLQDRNWPVAPLIAEILKEELPQLEKEIAHILQTEDGHWKYDLLMLFGPDWPCSWRQMLAPLVFRPSRLDWEAEVDQIASEIYFEPFDMEEVQGLSWRPMEEGHPLAEELQELFAAELLASSEDPINWPKWRARLQFELAPELGLDILVHYH